jgi:hypothetical protein
MNIIFGVYNGYNNIKTEKGGIYYFIKSLRKYNQECKVVILCEKENIFTELKRLCDDNNVFLYSDFTQKYDMVFYRFEIYYEILNELKDANINRVLLSDIDDVIFQEDPFSIPFTQDLYCAAEQNIIDDTNNWSSNENRYWIRESQEIIPFLFENFENKYVVCAGTIMANFKGTMTFLYFYVDVQSRRKNEKGVNDQGLYNIYVYNYSHSKYVPEYKISRILTLDRVPFETLKISNGKIINDNGEIYAVIHQINRCNLEFMKSLVEN